MSYQRNHGGGRRRYNRDEDDDRRRAEAFETPEQQLRTAIIRFGEVDAEQEVPRVAQQIRDHSPPSIPAIAEGFRIGVTEEPYKIPYYAYLLRALDDGNVSPDAELLGKQVLDDFWKGFQAFLDKLAWREVRLCVHFFAHLTVARAISASSMLALLQSFSAVLDEFGVSHGRAKNAARCAAEGLMRAGSVLKAHSPSEVTAIINSIQSYADIASANKHLVAPLAILHAPVDVVICADEILDVVISVLGKLDASNFEESATSYPQPYTKNAPAEGSSSFFDLPSVLVPPEVIELENLADGEESQASIPKHEEWPEYRLNLFDNEITADPSSPLGAAVNTAIADIIDIFEVNRKECARLLLELPKWSVPGTFKPRPGVPTEDGETSGPAWQLESCVMEAILSKLLLLPKGAHKPVYYITLVTDLCKLSPSTVGPALGKSIRRLYSLLADGLDVDIALRFAEWFATHMSNFGFQWVWKEWIPDLSLPRHHPKRNFIRKAIEIEIRLAYYDRIFKTLPEPFQAPDADALPEQAPGPEFHYDDPLYPHHDAAQALLNQFRGRAKAEEVLTHIESLKRTLPESADSQFGPFNVDAAIRNITVQALLNVGARSFSHLLNAIERYLPVLRSLAAGGSGGSSREGAGSGDAEAKSDILGAVAEFWTRNRQMIVIVYDKLMQYQIVDPSDVVLWAFGGAVSAVSDTLANGAGLPASIDASRWAVVQGALDKAIGRVAVARRKVSALRKEEDDYRARALAKASGTDGSMEVDPEAAAAGDDAAATDSPQLTTALKAHSALIREQKAVLSRTVNEFVRVLAGTGACPALSESGWQNRAGWDDAEWEVWETWGWYRNFCRLYAPYLRNYSTTLGTIAFAKIEGKDDPAALLLRKVWNVATGQEA